MSRARKIGIVLGFLFAIFAFLGVLMYEGDDSREYAKGVVIGIIVLIIVYIVLGIGLFALAAAAS